MRGAMKCAVTNLNQFQGHDAEHLEYLDKIGVEAIAIVEAIRANGDPIDVAALLGPRWRTNQDLSSSDRAGSCIAWKVGRIRGLWSRLNLGFTPYLRTGARVAMRARWISVKALTPRRALRRFRRRIRLAAAHYAPDWADRDGSLRHRMEDELLDLINAPGRAPLTVGADVNDPIHQAAAALGLEAKGNGVIAVLFDATKVAIWNFRVDRWGIRHGATDHGDLIFDCRRK